MKTEDKYVLIFIAGYNDSSPGLMWEVDTFDTIEQAVKYSTKIPTSQGRYIILPYYEIS